MNVTIRENDNVTMYNDQLKFITWSWDHDYIYWLVAILILYIFDTM